MLLLVHVQKRTYLNTSPKFFSLLLSPSLFSFSFQKLLEDSSFTLHEALNQKPFLKSVSVVIPKSWRDGKCQTVVRPPKGETPYRQADIVISGNNHPIYGASPYTQQSKQCGQPGDFMALPFSFLTKWNQTWETWGDPANLFVHEWVKLRYGTFDEFGYANDPIYPNYFKSRDQIFPTGTSNEPINGIWVDAYGSPDCVSSPTNACYFQPVGTNDHVTCSLGYMHFLPTVNAFCPTSTNGQGRMAPTKQNVLCQGKSSLEIILGHEDFSTHLAHKSTAVDINMKPMITVVREPEPQYVLIMETSSSCLLYTSPSPRD